LNNEPIRIIHKKTTIKIRKGVKYNKLRLTSFHVPLEKSRVSEGFTEKELQLFERAIST